MSWAEIELALPCTSEAPALARSAISELPRIDAVRDDAVLVVSELVTNAVLHSGGQSRDTIMLRVRRGPRMLTICVRDAGRSDQSPHLRPDGPHGHGGFGLMLVERIAQEWHTRHDDQRVVWATMNLAA